MKSLKEIKLVGILKNECGLCSNIELSNAWSNPIVFGTYKILSLLCLLNIIIWIKSFVDFFSKRNKVPNKRLIVDIYIAAKWIIVLIFMFGVFSFGKNIDSFIVIYLLASNIFMYIFFHAFHGNKYDCGNKRYNEYSRFIYAILAFSFSILTFAYLYAFTFNEYFNWTLNIDDKLVNLQEHNIINAFYLSFSGAFTLTLGNLPIPDYRGKLLLMLELVNTFIFITIIISNSLPKSPITTKET